MIKENYHLPIAWFLVLLGIGCYFALVLWKSLKRYFRAHVLTDISAIATSPRWWLAILGIFLLAVIFSPYVEQHRLPFIQTQNEDITGSIPTRILDGDTPWLTVALKEYDQARLVGPQSNPRILEYLQSIPGAENLTDKVDWASAFAEWSLNRVGIIGPKNMKPKSWVAWGRQITEPKPGAIAIFNFDGTEHVGFVLTDAEDSLIVIGGNQETRVEVRRYPKSNVVDYRMPTSTN